MTLVPLSAWTEAVPTPHSRGQYYISGDGRKWYYLLVERGDITAVDETQGGTVITVPRSVKPKAVPLLAEIPLAELGGKLLVCLQKEERLFTVFDTLFEFASFIRPISEAHRCFYEIIIGDFPQKPHFDLELSRKDHEDIFDTLDPEAIKDEVIAALLEVLEVKGVKLDLSRDLLLYSSHGKDKISFHIVVDNYCHCNNIEAKQLYQQVWAKLPATLTSLRPAPLDPAVYSKKQQFRILGCQKYGSGRKKVFRETWSYRGQLIRYRYVEPPENPRHEYLMQLEASLVSNTSMCLMLPSFFEGGEGRLSNPEYREISTDTALRAIQLLADYAGLTPDDKRFPYQLLDLKGSIIVLKRLRPSMCRICSRVHENENPFLFVIENKVYFHCRRAPGNKKLLVGKLGEGPEKSPPETSREDRARQVRRDQEAFCQDVLTRVQDLARAPTRQVKAPASLRIDAAYARTKPGELQASIDHPIIYPPDPCEYNAAYEWVPGAK